MNLIAIVTSALKRFDKRTHLTSEQVKEIVSSLKSEDVFIEDEDYRLFNLKEIWLCAQFAQGLNLYVKNYFDCDNYAANCRTNVLKTLVACPFGICYVEYKEKKNNVTHCLNIFIDDKKRLWFYEPQTSSYFNKPDDWAVKMVMI